MSPKSFLPKVKQQYEELPYPPRNPEDESKRLIKTDGESLVSINHYGFSGRAKFDANFNVLVAGGGTGDSTVYLAEQLKETGASITYIDLSSASRKIAEQRAACRNLTNITFITGSLLDVEELTNKKFDYISCSGVLHHLKDPNAGLIALRNVLKSNGAIYLMLYGKYGRVPVYEMQQLLRTLLPENAPTEEKIRATREIIAGLPESNKFKQNQQSWIREISPEGYGDSGLFDLLMHSQDQAYCVTDIYQLAEKCQLTVTDFIGERRYAYNPLTQTTSNITQNLSSHLNKQKQYEVAELLNSQMSKHTFVLAREHSAASFSDLDLKIECEENLKQHIPQIADALVIDKTLSITLEYDVAGRKRSHRFDIMGTAINKQLFQQLNDHKSNKSLIEAVTTSLNLPEPGPVAKELSDLYHLFNLYSYMFLNKQDC